MKISVLANGDDSIADLEKRLFGGDRKYGSITIERYEMPRFTETENDPRRWFLATLDTNVREDK